MKHCHQKSFKGEEFVCLSFVLDPVELAFMEEQLSHLNQEEHFKSYLPITLHLVVDYNVLVVMVTINALSTIASFISSLFFYIHVYKPPLPKLY